MADWTDDEDDDDYFSEVEADAELTGFEPKFKLIPEMSISPSELANLRVDELVQAYRNLRDQLATDRKGYKTREGRVKTFMSMISMTLRDRADNLGVDTFATANGTAFRNKKEKFPVEDWSQLTDYIKNTGNFQLLQKRTSPNAVKEIRESEGVLPPGVGNIVEVEFSVRAPTKRRS